MKYKLSEIKAIEKEFPDKETQEDMKKMILDGKIDWIESNMPTTPPRTPDGGDISLADYRKELEQEIGIEIVNE